MNCASLAIRTSGRALCLLLAVLHLTPSSAQQRHVIKLTRESQENFSTGGPFLPLVSSGAILIVKDNPSDAPLLVRIGAEGELERISLAIPEAHNITIAGISAGPDGTIVAVGSAYSNDGRGTTFLLRIDRDRKQQTLTQVWPYVGKAVVVTPGGIVLSIGWIREGDRIAQYNVLKRFDSQGRVVQTTTIRARGKVIPGDDPALDRPRDAAVFSSLRASKDRIGWMTNGNEYIELDFDGREIYHTEGPPHGGEVGILALSADNDAIVSVSGTNKPGYWKLDRLKREWTPIEIPGGKECLLLGFDGPTIVMTTSSGKIRRYDLDEVTR